MDKRREVDRRQILDRRVAKSGRRVNNEMGCFVDEECRRVNVSDRRIGPETRRHSRRRREDRL